MKFASIPKYRMYLAKHYDKNKKQLVWIKHASNYIPKKCLIPKGMLLVRFILFKVICM